jgi:hypothetical protein
MSGRIVFDCWVLKHEKELLISHILRLSTYTIIQATETNIKYYVSISGLTEEDLLQLSLACPTFRYNRNSNRYSYYGREDNFL